MSNANVSSLTLHRVRQGDVLCPLLGHLLDIEAGTRIVGQLNDPRESVQTVSHSNIDGLPEDSVPLVGISDDLKGDSL